MRLDKLKINLEQRARTAFYASDFGKADLDLFFAFTQVKKSNPATWNETLKWGAGKGVEEQMLKVLKDSNVVPQDYDQKLHGRVDIQRAGVTIHGYIDAATSLEATGTPIEIKSVNNKNFVGLKKYKDGYPPENYVGQLAIYMDARDSDTGFLFVASIDGLFYKLFKAQRLRSGVIKCGKVYVDLDEFYSRLYHLKTEYIDKNLMPPVTQYLYKYPVDKLDWHNVSKSAITKARNNRKVIGDYQVTWSDWRDLIIKLQKAKRGYSNKELEIILEATKGYTTWGKDSEEE